MIGANMHLQTGRARRRIGQKLNRSEIGEADTCEPKPGLQTAICAISKVPQNRTAGSRDRCDAKFVGMFLQTLAKPPGASVESVHQ